MEKQVRIEDLCCILEIPVSSYGLSSVMPKEQAEEALQDFKDLVKKQHRVLVKKYHPDLPSSGDFEESRMKEVNGAVDLIMKLSITRVKQKPVAQNVHFHFSQNPFFNDSTTSANFSGSFQEFKFRFR